MKKKIATFFALLAFSPLLTNCASQQDVNQLNYQLRVVNKKLEDMKLGTVGQMQERQAASSSQLDDLRREILVLRGQMDEISHYNRQLKEQNTELELSLQQTIKSLEAELAKERQQYQTQSREKDAKLGQLEARLAQQQDILKSIQESRVREAQSKAEAAAKAAEKARARAQASSSALSNSKGNGVVSISAEKKKTVYDEAAQDNSDTKPASQSVKTAAQAPSKPSQPESGLFDEADKAYANGKFDKAYKLYEEYATKNASSEKAVTANFMMGESLFQQGEFDQAILQYQKIISNHPSHARAASALLKQGMAFEKLSDFETAKIIYKKIAASYPSSPEANSAKERSAKLN